ncbi:MAG: PRTRC system protein C [Methylococcales bacterium]
MTDLKDGQIIRPTRVFKMGMVRLADPAPDLPPDEALKLYSANYPHLANVALGQPQLIGGEIIYETIMPDVKTKG